MVILLSFLEENIYVRNFDLNNDDGVDIFEVALKTHECLNHKPLNTQARYSNLRISANVNHT